MSKALFTFATTASLTTKPQNSPSTTGYTNITNINGTLGHTANLITTTANIFLSTVTKAIIYPQLIAQISLIALMSNHVIAVMSCTLVHPAKRAFITFAREYVYRQGCQL